MKGIVFLKFAEMVERKFGEDILDDIIESSNLPSGGVYVATGYYCHTEIVNLTVSLSKETGVAVPDLLFAFGDFLFKNLYELRPDLVSFASTAFELIAGIDSVIHPEVLKLYPDAKLPKFEVLSLRQDELRIVYRSSRHFDKLAEGLMQGCLRHFGENANISMSEYDKGTLFVLEKTG